MARLINLYLAFCFLLSNHVCSSQPTHDSRIEHSDDFQRMIVQQQLVNNIQTTFLSLVYRRTARLEKVVKLLSRKVENLENTHVVLQNLTSRMVQFEGLKSVIQTLIERFDKMEEELGNITSKPTTQEKSGRSTTGSTTTSAVMVQHGTRQR